MQLCPDRHILRIGTVDRVITGRGGGTGKSAAGHCQGVAGADIDGRILGRSYRAVRERYITAVGCADRQITGCVVEGCIGQREGSNAGGVDPLIGTTVDGQLRTMLGL